MQILLTTEEKINFFHTALCNGLDYISGYGLELTYSKRDYLNAKENLNTQGKNLCYEDILIQILIDGGKLKCIDHEADGEYNSSILLQDVMERFELVPVDTLIDFIQENDDAGTADVLIQTIFYKEIIFG
jgi:hypothetical protein